MARAPFRLQELLRRRVPASGRCPPTQPDSIFQRLPVEILLHIIECLCPSAGVAFALTCHIALDLVGDEPFKTVRTHPKELPLLRSVLSRDLGDWDYCPTCETLHPTYGSEGPGVPLQRKTQEKQWLARRFPSTPPCYEWTQVHFQDGYFLTWRDLHLVMKRVRHGPEHGIPTQNLRFRNGRVFEHIKSSQSFEPALVDGALQLTRKIRFTVPKASPCKVDKPPSPHGQSCGCQIVSSQLPVDRPGCIPLALCLHMYARIERLCPPADVPGLENARTPLQLLDFHERMACVLSHKPGQSSKCEACRLAPKNCPVCDVEYHVGRDGRNTVVVTARYDFGRGESPDDPIWTRHRQHVRRGLLSRLKAEADEIK